MKKLSLEELKPLLFDGMTSSTQEETFFQIKLRELKIDYTIIEHLFDKEEVERQIGYYAIGIKGGYAVIPYGKALWGKDIVHVKRVRKFTKEDAIFVKKQMDKLEKKINNMKILYESEKLRALF